VAKGKGKGGRGRKGEMEKIPLPGKKFAYMFVLRLSATTGAELGIDTI